MTNPPARPALIAAALLVALPFAAPAFAQASQVIAFARGNDNASVKGTIVGDTYKDYLITAHAGQKMGVSLITKIAYFNILPPGSTGEAIYNSSMDGNDATGVVLPKSGQYRIRVYTMGAVSRTKQAVPFQLSVTVMN
ncbi:hypothetical protein [Novosphingobium huizhouense]|uniref:hypothetical protein n=1 Tax=Novosphingobium huizhouense TaxID=2866625 RepID=UPI001CD8EF05|nr:hypothetical protein [Novosphingobium huizhouense]